MVWDKLWVVVVVEGDWCLQPPEVFGDNGVHGVYLPAHHLEAALVGVCLGAAKDHEAPRWLEEIHSGGVLLRHLGSILWLRPTWGIVDEVLEELVLMELVTD